MTLPIFIVGQGATGKTWIANHLVDNFDSVNQNYHETQGVRILEMTKTINNLNLDVEIWDVSGNSKFYSLLSGISKDAIGLVYVSNGSESKVWESLFSHLSPSQVLIVNVDASVSVENWKTSVVIRDFSLVESNMARLILEFDKFLVNLYQIQKEKKELEESSILGS